MGYIRAIVSSNLNNEVHTSLTYLNCNNEVSIANHNNGSRLLPVDILSIEDNEHCIVNIYVTLPLGKK